MLTFKILFIVLPLALAGLPRHKETVGRCVTSYGLKSRKKVYTSTWSYHEQAIWTDTATSTQTVTVTSTAELAKGSIAAGPIVTVTAPVTQGKTTLTITRTSKIYHNSTITTISTKTLGPTKIEKMTSTIHAPTLSGFVPIASMALVPEEGSGHGSADKREIVKSGKYGESTLLSGNHDVDVRARYPRLVVCHQTVQDFPFTFTTTVIAPETETVTIRTTPPVNTAVKGKSTKTITHTPARTTFTVEALTTIHTTPVTRFTKIKTLESTSTSTSWVAVVTSYAGCTHENSIDRVGVVRLESMRPKYQLLASRMDGSALECCTMCHSTPGCAGFMASNMTEKVCYLATDNGLCRPQDKAFTFYGFERNAADSTDIRVYIGNGPCGHGGYESLHQLHHPGS